jgi:SAM-dependent methyltransferase
MIRKLALKIARKNRSYKYDFFIEKYKPTSATKILDVGVIDKEENASDNYLEKNYPFPENITALGIESLYNFHKRYPKVNTVAYGGGTFPFKDKIFDIVFSSAVIEHVGNYDLQVNFLREIYRCGSRAFLTTPNRFFPIEVHTLVPVLHWLPKKQFDFCLTTIGKGANAGDYMHLLSYKVLLNLLKEAGILNYLVMKNKIIGMTMDFIIMVDNYD